MLSEPWLPGWLRSDGARGRVTRTSSAPREAPGSGTSRSGRASQTWFRLHPPAAWCGEPARRLFRPDTRTRRLFVAWKFPARLRTRLRRVRTCPDLRGMSGKFIFSQEAQKYRGRALTGSTPPNGGRVDAPSARSTRARLERAERGRLCAALAPRPPFCSTRPHSHSPKPKHVRGGGARTAFTYYRSRQTTDTTRPLNFQKDDERGVCEKLIRFESFLNPSLSNPSL